MSLFRLPDRRSSPLAAQSVSLEQALTELAPHVRACVYRYVGPRADADDIVQEALIEVASALARFRGESSLKTYAIRISLRVATRHLRSARRREQPGLHAVPAAADTRTPESLAAHRESLRRLYRCLDRLSPKRRTAFVLCAVERLSHAEAAEIEGTSVETMRARLKRARAELGRLLRADPHLSQLLSREEQDA